MEEATLQRDTLNTEKNVEINIVLEADPCPLVKIFANKLRKASRQAGFANIVKQTEGCFALKSNSDPQALTFKIRGNEIALFSGLKPEAKIIIHTPLDDTGSQKTRVEKLWRHPLYAMRVGRLLDFHQPNWVDSAKRFWTLNKDYPGMPSSIKIECSDENREFVLGASSEKSWPQKTSSELKASELKAPEMTLIGTANALSEFLSGDAIFIQSAMSGKLNGTMSFEHAVVLSDLSLQMLLGERE